jgi:hypothetical protein
MRRSVMASRSFAVCSPRRRHHRDGRCIRGSSSSFSRSAQPDFDERRYGSIADLMRACQKDGLLRLERDRQGALRVFANGSTRSSVPHGWGVAVRENGSEAAPEVAPVVDVIPEVIAAPVVDAQNHRGR